MQTWHSSRRSARRLIGAIVVAAGTATILAADPAPAPHPPAARAKAPAIQPSFNAYFPADFKDADYQKGAVAKVSRNWMVPGAHLPAKGSKTVVQSTIARDGSLGAVLVTMKSGSKEWDEAALAAVKKAAPLGALPGSYPQSTIEVHWHFSAN